MLRATLAVSVNGLDDLTDREAIAEAALPAALEVVRDVWIRAVTGEQFPGMARVVDDADYAAALRDPAALVYPDDNAWSGAVVVPPGDGYDAAVRYEKARKERDMKPALLSGPKARIGKRGRYNIIPLKPKGQDDVLFRTVSDRSPAGSWIYPGRLPAGVIDAVAAASSSLIAEAVSEALQDLYEGK